LIEVINPPKKKVKKIPWHAKYHSVDASKVSTISVPGSWDSTQTYRQCVHTKKDGNRCRGKAMNGMDRCRMHGGALAKASLKHGIYSKYVPENLQGKYEEFANDPLIKSLRQEIGIARSLFAVFMDNLENFDEVDSTEINSMLEQIRKLVATCSKIEDGEKYSVDVHVLHIIMNQVIHIITEEVIDVGLRTKIADRFQELSIPSAS